MYTNRLQANTRRHRARASPVHDVRLRVVCRFRGIGRGGDCNVKVVFRSQIVRQSDAAGLVEWVRLVQPKLTAKTATARLRDKRFGGAAFACLRERGLASPTGHALMYGDDSIRIELAGDAKERAA